jgi:hypothetical protein
MYEQDESLLNSIISVKEPRALSAVYKFWVLRNPKVTKFMFGGYDLLEDAEVITCP